jgi:hypothetical protein
MFIAGGVCAPYRFEANLALGRIVGATAQNGVLIGGFSGNAGQLRRM